MGNYLVGYPSLSFSVACTEMHAYLAMKYFLEPDKSFMGFKFFG